MIKYLAKLVSKKQHAEDILNGKLYMNAAAYYHKLEKGQGDEIEGVISHNIMMFKNLDRPIFCMYCLEDDDIKDNSTLIDEKMILDFKCGNGYIVLIEYESFKNKISQLDTCDFQLIGGKVSYGWIDNNLSIDLFINDGMQNLFIKQPGFAYQKEFRIAVAEPLPEKLKKIFVNGQEHSQLMGYDAKQYCFKTDIRDISKYFPVQSLEKKGSEYILPLDK